MAPTSMIFGNTKIHGPGSDAWFWPDVDLAGPPVFKHFLEDIDDWRAPGPDGKKERRYAAVYAPAEAGKAFDPSQPRWPAGDERGGQWASAAGGDAAESADPSLPMSPQLAEAVAYAMSECQEDGIRTGKEKLYVYGPDGDLVNVTSGNENSVKSGYAFTREASGGATVHNHPTSLSLSENDIVTFLTSPTNHMLVVGHNGTTYRASKTAATLKLSEIKDSIAESWWSIVNEGVLRYWPQVKEGQMTEWQADYDVTHRAAQALAEKYKFIYTRTEA